MSRFSYSGGPLDRRYIVDTEIQAMLDDLSTFINTPSLSEENLRQRTVNFRHILQPPTIETGAEVDTRTLTYNGPWAGYYAITQSVLKFNIQHGSLPNIHEAQAPVIQVKALVTIAARNSINPNLMTRCCIGHSTDGGVTWTPLVDQSRPFDPFVNFNWFDGLQLDYMTGLINYFPKNYNYGTRCIVMASAGGATKDTISNGSHWYCVMVDSNVEGWGWPRIEIEGSARWTEKTP